MLRCSDGNLYVGHTSDVASRERAHNAGSAAQFTAARGPVRLVYSESHESIELAIKREQQLKRWSRSKKEALIGGDSRRLKALSKCRRK